VVIVYVDREPLYEQGVIEDRVATIDFLVKVIIRDGHVSLGGDKNKWHLNLVE
jgi:hypothetical protein